ncbi:polysaccharide biosynthesis tyrosine autokinase [uncultured Amnibacterium sp.]|uniref:polysaccharide biosynthesis tyrosine autokinase n=1 Tax=uncultured Amnibacterium sp. TaxID=1631851 RepID=UPI0035C9CD82
MDLHIYLATIRRHWLLLAVPIVLGLVASIVVLGAQVPKYQSTARIYVSVGNATNASDLSQGNSFAQAAAANYAALADQPYVLQNVREQLDIADTPDQIADEMTTSVEPNTSIISIDVLDRSATRAAEIANVTAQRLRAAVTALTPAATDGTQNVRLTVVRTGVAASSAATPNRPMTIALGLLGGLLLGVLLVILRELLNTKVRSLDELEQLTGVPTVGQIPVAAGIDRRPLVMVDDRGGLAAEGFRSLELNIDYLRAPNGVVVIAIASAVPSEGKTTVAANLAVALALAGQRVALVDADLRRPRLHTIFGFDNGIGLTEVLIGRVELRQAVQPWGLGENTVSLLPAGSIPPNPGELLQSPRLREILDELAREADVVIVDGPPLLAVSDSAVLARTVDAVLLVSSLQRSHRATVARAVAALQGVGARVLGSVVTMTRPSRAASDAYLRYGTRPVQAVDAPAATPVPASPIPPATKDTAVPNPPVPAEDTAHDTAAAGDVEAASDEEPAEHPGTPEAGEAPEDEGPEEDVIEAPESPTPTVPAAAPRDPQVRAGVNRPHEAHQDVSSIRVSSTREAARILKALKRRATAEDLRVSRPVPAAAPARDED